MFIMNWGLAAFVGHLKTPLPGMIYAASYLKMTFWTNLYDGMYWFQLWYIRAELTLHLIAPILLFGLWRYGRPFFAVLIGLALASVGYYFKLSLDHKQKLIQLSPSFYASTRCAPWMFGLMLGYIIFQQRQTGGDKRRFSNVTVILSSAVCFLVMALDMHVAQTQYSGMVYMTSTRITWGASLAWLVYLMTMGHLTTLNAALSHPTFQMISQLSYSAYLWHVPLGLITLSIRRTPVYLNWFMLLQHGISITVTSLMVAVPWSLLFELPYKNVQQVIFRKNCVISKHRPNERRSRA